MRIPKGEPMSDDEWATYTMTADSDPASLVPQLRTSLAHQLVVLADEVTRTEAAAKEAYNEYCADVAEAQLAFDAAVAEADKARHEANKARKAARNKYNEVIQQLTPGVRVVIGGEP